MVDCIVRTFKDETDKLILDARHLFRRYQHSYGRVLESLYPIHSFALKTKGFSFGEIYLSTLLWWGTMPLSSFEVQRGWMMRNFGSMVFLRLCKHNFFIYSLSTLFFEEVAERFYGNTTHQYQKLWVVGDFLHKRQLMVFLCLFLCLFCFLLFVSLKLF